MGEAQLDSSRDRAAKLPEALKRVTSLQAGNDLRGTVELPTFWRRPGVARVLLFAIVLAVFWPTLRNDFISYDDNGYVTENPWVRQGLTWANLAHAFQTTEIAYWHPLTWCSHLLDVQLFGLQPWGHHLTSVLWHAVNAVLLFAWLRRITGATGRSCFVAALFALHPMHVESVAWVAERKDVLSTFFALAALWCYSEWVIRRAAGEARTARWYGGALVAFAAGLMSKPMVVTLPCLMMLLDYWPLRRGTGGTIHQRARQLVQFAGEKLPFLLLSALASVAAVHAQASLGTLQSTAQYSLATRIANALVSYLRYLEKGFLPTKLAVFYPHPGAPPAGWVVTAAILLVSVTAVCVWRARRNPYLAAGWFWFLGTLVPVIGLVQVGGQAMADRYSYLPLVGIFLMVTWGLADVCAGRPKWSLMLPVAALATLTTAAAGTVQQIRLWRDSPTLFQHAIAVTPENWAAHFALGYHYAKSPEHLTEAIAEYRETVRLTPNAAEAHHSLAAMLARRAGSGTEALEEFQKAIRLNPTLVEAHLGLGQMLLRVPGRTTDAVAALEAAARLAPQNVAVRATLSRARLALGEALEQRAGHESEAMDAYRAAIQLEPENADARLRLADLLAGQAATTHEAIAEYRRVLELRPDWIEVRNNLGIALAQLPDGLPAAIAEYEAVLRVKPDFGDAHSNLANTLARDPARVADAEREYRVALRLQPGDFRVHFNFAQFLLRQPGGSTQALEHLEEALRLQPDLEPARELIARLRADAQRS